MTNLATVTINLPRCAILARNDLNLFYHRLEHLLSLVIGALLAAIVAYAAFRLGALNRGGALAAFILGTIVFGLGGLPWAITAAPTWNVITVGTESQYN